MKLELIELVKDKYKEILDSLSDKENETIVPLEKLKDSVEECINNLDKFKVFDMNSIREYFQNDEELFNKMIVYQKLVDYSYFSLTKEQKKFIKDTFIRIHTILLTMIKSIKTEYSNLIKSNIRLKILVGLRKKLMSNAKLTNDDASFLSSYVNERLDSNLISVKEANNLLIYIGEISVKDNSNEHSNKQNKITSLLDEDSLISLFSSFSYDFNDFGSSKYVLLNYGNYDNIKDILTIFKENNINLNIIQDARKISHILAFSKKETISVIVNNIIEDSKEDNLDIQYVFSLYLKEPSIFLSTSKSLITLNGNKILVPGAFQDYLHNRLLLKNNKISVASSMRKASSFFTYSRIRVDENLRKFKLYNVPEELYFKTLSSFASKDPLSVIDKFIELGCLDYLKDNMSKLNISGDNIIFYRIKYLKLKGKTNDDLYRKYNSRSEHCKVEFISDVTNSNNSFIKSDNKEMAAEVYYPVFNSSYDEIIDKSLNNGPFNKVFLSPIINTLEQFKKSEFEYDLNGIIISRYKVLRFYETLLDNNIEDSLDILLYSICKNSLLTKEEFSKIEDIVDYINKSITKGGTRL